MTQFPSRLLHFTSTALYSVASSDCPFIIPGTDHKENTVFYCQEGLFTDPLPSNGCPIVWCKCVAGMCLPTRCLAMGIHVTLLYILLPETKSGPKFVLKHKLSLLWMNDEDKKLMWTKEWNRDIASHKGPEIGSTSLNTLMFTDDLTSILYKEETTERNVQVNLNRLRSQHENIVANRATWYLSHIGLLLVLFFCSEDGWSLVKTVLLTV
jgi:hypothetical protein